MRLIVGLGNPGRVYEDTRHNVGFMVVERFAARHGVRRFRPSGKARAPLALYADAAVGRRTVRLLMPQTMMNNSGEALTNVSEWDVEAGDTLIVCDDVNLPLGALRLRPSGSDGGHHGLASCLEALGTQQVPRLRIGIGRARLPDDLTGFVLSPFTAAEHQTLNRMLERAVEACELWVTKGIEAAMNASNAKP